MACQIPSLEEIKGKKATTATVAAIERPLLVLEYIETTLFVSLARGQLTKPSTFYQTCRRLLRGTASAFDFLPLQGIVHGDVKSNNILLNTRTIVAKLSDFGEAQETGLTTTQAWATGDKDEGQRKKNSGTMAYHAPEILLEQVKQASRKAEIHAFGVVLWECLTRGAIPHRGKSAFQLVSLAMDTQRPTLLDIPKEKPVSIAGMVGEERAWNTLHSLTTTCLARDAATRPTATQLTMVLGANKGTSLHVMGQSSESMPSCSLATTKPRRDHPCLRNEQQRNNQQV